VRATVPLTIPLPGLDPNLTIDEIDAVSYALARETDTQNLLRFGASFFPRYPIAAGLLMAKAKLVASSSEPTALRDAVENGVRQPLDLLRLAALLVPEFSAVATVLRAHAKVSSTPSQGTG
jgi:hypothetical protein